VPPVGIAESWVPTRPDDDTFDPGTPAKFCDFDWRQIGLTLRVAPSTDLAWQRTVTIEDDFRLLVEPNVKLVGVSVDNDGRSTWVHIVTLELQDPLDEDAFVPGGSLSAPTLAALNEIARNESWSSDLWESRLEACPVVEGDQA
jgi:hypothetical protein